MLCSGSSDDDEPDAAWAERMRARVGVPRIAAGRGGGGGRTGRGAGGRGVAPGRSILHHPRTQSEKRTGDNLPRGDDRRVRWDGNIEREVFDVEPSTSSLLPEDCWPIGHTREMVDKLTFDKALQLRLYQDNKQTSEKSSRKHLPGQLVKRVEQKRPVELVSAMEDDGDDNISRARYLRPATDITKWWKLTPKLYKTVLERKLDDRHGTWSQVPHAVFESCHNLGNAMELKHFCRKNFDVAKRKSKAILRGGEDGKAMLDGLSSEYYLPDSMHECRQAVSVYGAVKRELFSWDDSMEIMLRVLLEVRDFAVVEDPKQRVWIFEAWFNSVLLENAQKCESPPMGFKPMPVRALRSLVSESRDTIHDCCLI